MPRPGRRASLRDTPDRRFPPLWSERQLDNLATELGEFERSIAAEDAAAQRAQSTDAMLAALDRGLYLRRRRLRRIALVHSSELRRSLGLGMRIDAFAASQPATVLDELAAHLSPIPLEDEQEAAA